MFIPLPDLTDSLWIELIYEIISYMHRDDEEFTDYSKTVPTYSDFSSFSNVKLVIYFPGFLDTYSRFQS